MNSADHCMLVLVHMQMSCISHFESTCTYSFFSRGVGMIKNGPRNSFFGPMESNLEALFPS